MKKIVFAVSALLLIGTSAFADTKVGILNLEELFSQTKQFKNAEETLKKQFEKEEEELNKDQQKLQKLTEDFSKNSPTMKEEDKKNQQKKITEEYKKLQDSQMKLQKKVGEKSNALRKDLMQQLESATKKVAEANGLDAIFIKGVAVYSKGELDITQKVINQLSKK